MEPYEYSTGEGLFGTTISAPVYDRTTDPPTFIGVAVVDVWNSALEKALGVSSGSDKIVEAIVLQSEAICPLIDLSLCELESFRKRGIAGNRTLCTNNCTAADFIDIEREGCDLLEDDFPKDLIADRSYIGLPHAERACCEMGTSEATTVCSVEPPVDDGDDGSNTALIGGIVGGVAGLLLVGGGAYYASKKNSGANTGGSLRKSEPVREEAAEPDIPVTTGVPITTPVVPAATAAPSAPYAPTYQE